jgi:hypothetical protein
LDSSGRGGNPEVAHRDGEWFAVEHQRVHLNRKWATSKFVSSAIGRSQSVQAMRINCKPVSAQSIPFSSFSFPNLSPFLHLCDNCSQMPSGIERCLRNEMFVLHCWGLISLSQTSPFCRWPVLFEL